MDVLVHRKVLWRKKAGQEDDTPVPTTTSRRVNIPVTPKTVVEAVTTPAAGNKHAVNFVRGLTEKEEALIQREFLKLNGVFPPLEKHCTRIKGLLPDDVSVFQVSGCVTKLHAKAVAGDLEMKDRAAYLASLRSHRKHWLTYSGDKYEEMRERLVTKGRKPTLAVREGTARRSRPRHQIVK